MQQSTHKLFIKPLWSRLLHSIQCNNLCTFFFTNVLSVLSKTIFTQIVTFNSMQWFIQEWFYDWGSIIVDSKKSKYFWDSNTTIHLKWQNEIPINRRAQEERNNLVNRYQASLWWLQNLSENTLCNWTCIYGIDIIGTLCFEYNNVTYFSHMKSKSKTKKLNV